MWLPGECARVLITCLRDGNSGLYSASCRIQYNAEVVFDSHTVLHMAPEERSRAG